MNRQKQNAECDCAVCARIRMIQENKNPYFVRELKTGYVVLGDSQRFEGYTLLLCKEHATELHFLEPEFRNQFLQEMSLVAEAVYHAFHPDKLNYELLGVGNAVHMHWHIFPRREGDTPAKGPVWRLNKEEMNAKRYEPDEKKLEVLKNKLNVELDKVLGLH